MISLIQKFCCPKLMLHIQRRYCRKFLEGNNEIVSSSENSDNCDGYTKNWPSTTRIHYKFHPETENAFNEQINAEFDAFYNYLSMASYFGRVDVALPGCELFFMQMQNEEREHAFQFLNYVKMRGGLVKLYSISAPTDQNWKCPLHAFKTALELEMAVSHKLVTANSIAEKHGDLNACDFIVTEFMDDQMKSIYELAKFVTVLSGIGDKTLSRFIFDRDLLSNHIQSRFNILKNKPNSD